MSVSGERCKRASRVVRLDGELGVVVGSPHQSLRTALASPVKEQTRIVELPVITLHVSSSQPPTSRHHSQGQPLAHSEGTSKGITHTSPVSSHSGMKTPQQRMMCGTSSMSTVASLASVSSPSPAYDKATANHSIKIHTLCRYSPDGRRFGWSCELESARSHPRQGLEALLSSLNSHSSQQ